MNEYDKSSLMMVKTDILNDEGYECTIKAIKVLKIQEK
jgi:hypothetical protein